MPKYLITTDKINGITHDGCELEEEGEAYLELTSQEVRDLKDLVQKRCSTDVDVLDLQNEMPEIYAKLKQAYERAVRSAIVWHWGSEAWENYREDCVSDYTDAIEFAKKHLGYTGMEEFDEDDWEQWDDWGEDDWDDETRAEVHFQIWFTHKLYDRSDKVKELLEMMIDIDSDPSDYKDIVLHLPEELIEDMGL